MSHAVLAPSAAYRWMSCPGSVRLIEAVQPAETSSAYAAEGTRAHEYAASLIASAIRSTVQPDNAEMEREVGRYVEYVRSIGRPFAVEARVPLFYSPDEHGTIDCVVFGSNSGLHIIDLKYGKGVLVEAERNPQLMIYAASFLDLFPGEVEQVTMHIVQPRREHFDTWTCTVDELDAFRAEVLAAVEACSQDDAPFRPSEKACRWCPVAAQCRAPADMALELAQADFAEIERGQTELPSALTLTDDQLAAIFRHAKAFKAWLGQIEDHVLSRVESGAMEVHGYKLVEKIGNRTWTNEEDAEKVLRARLRKKQERYVSKLISPAEAERRLKGEELSTRFRNNLDSVITRPKNGLALVPESDKRPAVVSSAAMLAEIDSGSMLDLAD